MLFKRRTPPNWLETLRVWVWPRRSWLRSTQYVTKRILRITATPHAIAAGVAVGMFTSFTPFMGLHFLVAAALAWILRGNLIASAMGTFFGNPISFPFIWAATFSIGNFVLGNSGTASGGIHIGEAMKGIFNAACDYDFAAAMSGFGDIWTPLLYPMLIGGCLLGPFVAIPAYILTKRATTLFRERRRNRLMEKAEAMKTRAQEMMNQPALAEKAG